MNLFGMKLCGDRDVTPPALIQSKGNFDMRKLMLTLGAATMAVSTMVLPVSSAEARKHYYKTYRGKNGRTYCTRSGGTTGAVVGGVGGALIGNSVAGRGDKLLGTVIGGAAGALGGRAIDRANTASRRCR
jgi:Glycine zipper 2TM domain